MATASFAGTNYALADTGLIGSFPRAGYYKDRVYCMSDECFSTSTAAAGSYFQVGKLPAGAMVQCTVVWPIDSDTYGEGDATAAAATGQLGLAVTTGTNARSADPDLFGDVAALTTATPQVIEPVPDGTIYTSTLDNALEFASNPVMLSADQNIVDTEGIAVKMLYKMGGKTC